MYYYFTFFDIYAPEEEERAKHTHKHTKKNNTPRDTKTNPPVEQTDVVQIIIRIALVVARFTFIRIEEEEEEEDTRVKRLLARRVFFVGGPTLHTYGRVHT